MPTVSESNDYWSDKNDPSDEDIARIFAPKKPANDTPMKISPDKPQTEIDFDELNEKPNNSELGHH